MPTQIQLKTVKTVKIEPESAVLAAAAGRVLGAAGTGAAQLGFARGR